MRKWNRMAGKVLITLTVASLVGMGTAMAEESKRPVPPTEGVPAEPGKPVSFTPFSAVIQSTKFLKTWGSDIQLGTNRKVTLSGYTDTLNSVSSISVQLYVQYWDGSGWNDLNSVGQFSKSFSSSVSGSVAATVQGGYYYRTKAVHRASDSGDSEERVSYSGYIYVS